MKQIFFAVVLSAIFGASAYGDHTPRHMHIIKNAGCGCCNTWAKIALKHGFDVTLEESSDYKSYKAKMGVPLELAGCHSARISGYVVEGHVPMNAIERLLAEKPDVYGITVPGMPAGSPGMGDDPDARYDVLTFSKADADSAKIFQKMGE
ncbi:MAG: DUF411 domain-containing protein [Rhizobiaceae bacterium]